MKILELLGNALILLLGINRFHDIFPSLLGTLPRLRVLILQSNGFHGALGKPESKLEYPKLQTIDVSLNYFASKLLYEHFQSWTYESCQLDF